MDVFKKLSLMVCFAVMVIGLGAQTGKKFYTDDQLDLLLRMVCMDIELRPLNLWLSVRSMNVHSSSRRVLPM